jgi:Ca2+-binding RTX toxin-like protein
MAIDFRGTTRQHLVNWFTHSKENALMALFKGTPGNDTLTGGDGNDKLIGLTGDDTLFGKDGNDTLLGGDGNDILNGGWGDDWIDPGRGLDVVEAGFGNDIVDLSGRTPGQDFFTLGHDLSHNGPGSPYGTKIRVLIDAEHNFGLVQKGYDGANWSNADTTQLINVINALEGGPGGGGMRITGTYGDDEFLVDPGDGGWLDIVPGSGSDLIRIGDSDGFVRLSYWDAINGVIANLGLGTVFQIGTGSYGDLFHIDTIFGHVNEFHGSNYNDRIAGSRLNDSFILGQGNDVLNGKAGFDTVRYDKGDVTALNVDLATGIATGKWSGKAFTDTLKNIEAVLGSSVYGDKLKGDDNANSLDGRGGNDLLDGRRGDDTLIGGDGKDRLFGGAGNDDLSGDGGNDKLAGGDGNDLLTGGAGADLFIFGNNGGYDHITDFDGPAGTDKIDLRAVTEITSYADLIANHLSEVVTPFETLVVIDDGAGTVISLSGLTIGDLSRADFMF